MPGQKKPLSAEKTEDLEGILHDLEKDLKEIEQLRLKVKTKKISFLTPQETKKVLEEIVVPPLELLKEEEEPEKPKKKR